MQIGCARFIYRKRYAGNKQLIYGELDLTIKNNRVDNQINELTVVKYLRPYLYLSLQITSRMPKVKLLAISLNYSQNLTLVYFIYFLLLADVYEYRDVHYMNDV